MRRAFLDPSVWFLSALSLFLVGSLAKADGLETTLEVKPNEVVLALPDFNDYYRITQGKLLNAPTGQCDPKVKLRANNIRYQVAAVEMEQAIALLYVTKGAKSSGLLFNQAIQQMKKAGKPLGKTIKFSIGTRGSDGLGQDIEKVLRRVATEFGFETVDSHVYKLTPNVTGQKGWTPIKQVTFSTEYNSMNPRAKPKDKSKPTPKL